MTRDDMLDIIDHSIRGASTKAVVEDLQVEISRRDVENFFNLVAEFVETGINTGFFDE